MHQNIAQSQIKISGKEKSGTSVNGRKDFLEKLHNQYWSEICHYLKKTFGDNPSDPEDVAQQAFVKFAAVDGRGTIRNPRAYLYRTARNIVMDEYRRTSRLHLLSDSSATQEIDHLTPERILLDKERFDIMAQAVKSMPEQRRQSFLLNRLQGLSCAEIARRTGYSESAVRQHISLAMADLEKAIAKADYGNEGNNL